MIRLLLTIFVFFKLFSQNQNIGTVIFFYPSDDELKVLSEKYGSDGFDDSFGDFSYYATEVETFLKKQKLKVVFNRDTIINIKFKNNKLYSFDRIKKNVSFGFILYDEKNKVELYENVYTDIDIMCVVKKFFDLKFKNKLCGN